jgi:hypothetical protein
LRLDLRGAKARLGNRTIAEKSDWQNLSNVPAEEFLCLGRSVELVWACGIGESAGSDGDTILVEELAVDAAYL